MLERLQNNEVIAERIKLRLGKIIDSIGKNIVYKDMEGSLTRCGGDCNGVLSMVVTDDRHKTINCLFENSEETGRRRIAVEILKTNTEQEQSCRINIGYTPGNTFFRGGVDVDIDLNSKKIYKLVNKERQEMDKAAMDALTMGLEVLDSGDLRLLESDFVYENDGIITADITAQSYLAV